MEKIVKVYSRFGEQTINLSAGEEDPKLWEEAIMSRHERYNLVREEVMAQYQK